MVGGAAYEIIVQSDVQLPISQGYGMSAAGALSAALAGNDAMDLGLSHARVVAIAHAAEVEARTGLGDIVPASLGGVDFRMEPGAPPHGVVRRIHADAEVLLAVLGPSMPTKAVLTDRETVKRIAEAGHRCVQEFSKAPSLEDLFRLGKRFTLETGLAHGHVKEAIEAAAPYGMCSMSMLGNSVFAVGQIEPLDALMKGMGAQRYRCKIDQKGARLITPGA